MPKRDGIHCLGARDHFGESSSRRVSPTASGEATTARKPRRRATVTARRDGSGVAPITFTTVLFVTKFVPSTYRRQQFAMIRMVCFVAWRESGPVIVPLKGRTIAALLAIVSTLAVGCSGTKTPGSDKASPAVSSDTAGKVSTSVDAGKQPCPTGPDDPTTQKSRHEFSGIALDRRGTPLERLSPEVYCLQHTQDIGYCYNPAALCVSKADPNKLAHGWVGSHCQVDIWIWDDKRPTSTLWAGIGETNLGHASFPDEWLRGVDIERVNELIGQYRARCG